MLTHAVPKRRHSSFEPLERRILLSANLPIPDAGEPRALFSENVGQWPDASVRFQYQSTLARVLHTIDGPRIDLLARPEPGADTGRFVAQSGQEQVESSIGLSFDGSSHVEPQGGDPVTMPGPWSDDGPHVSSADMVRYETIVYPDLYPGIDLQTWAYSDSLKYEFHVAPNADYRNIQLSYEGTQGISVSNDGTLRITTAAGELTDDAPYVYQDVGGSRVDVPGRFLVIDEDSYSFQLGVYDTDRPLVIDPEITWGRFIGGEFGEQGADVATDAVGNAYFAGSTTSDDFPIIDPFGESSGVIGAATVSKVTHEGELEWSVRLGGRGAEFARAITVDIQGNVLVAGITRSPDFPTFGAWDSIFNGFDDGWLAKFSSAGDLLWSTFVGGVSTDILTDVATDLAGNIIVTGITQSESWRFGNRPAEPINGTRDIFVVKLDPDGDLLWGHKFGGTQLNIELPDSISVNSLGEIFIAGHVDSPTDFPTGNLSPSFSGWWDAFLTKFSPSGVLEWSTFHGGTGLEDDLRIAIDSTDQIVMTGITASLDLPTPGGFDTTYNASPPCADCIAGYDGFVAKWTPAGTLSWGSYLGEFPKPTGWLARKIVGDIAVDSEDNLIVAGSLSGKFDEHRRDPTVDLNRMYLSTVKSDGASAVHSYFGTDQFNNTNLNLASIAIDRADNILGTGSLGFSDFFGDAQVGDPLNGFWDAMVVKFGAETPPPPPATSHGLFEFLAKDVAYRDWSEGNTVDLQQLGFHQSIVLTIDRVFRDNVTGFDAFGLYVEGDNPSNVEPILAVRGSVDFLTDWFDDFNPSGVGVGQFEANRVEILAWLRDISRRTALRPSITGHSLGGALAQLVASEYTRQASENLSETLFLDELITFNSPAVARRYADQFRSDFVRGGVMHYITNGDPVSMAGEAFLKGFWRRYSFSDINIVHNHTHPVLVEKTTAILDNGETDERLRAPDVVMDRFDTTQSLNSPFYFHTDPDYFLTLGALQILIGNIPGLEGIPGSLLFRVTAEANRRKVGQLWHDAQDQVDQIVSTLTCSDPTAQVTLPDFDLTVAGLLDLRASGLSARCLANPTRMRLQGQVQLPQMFNFSADFSGDNYIELSSDGMNLVGQLTAEDIPIVPNYLTARQVGISINTVEGRIEASGLLGIIPWGLDVGMSLGFLNGQWNSIAVSVSGLNIPLSFIIPGGFLQKVEGRVNHVAEPPLLLGGGVGLSLGRPIDVTLPAWAGGRYQGKLIGVDVGGDVDINHLTATGAVKIAEGLATFDATLEVNWLDGFVAADGSLSVLGGLIQVPHAGFRADTDLNLSMSANATFAVPDVIPFIGGSASINGTMALEFTNDDVFSNDFALAAATVDISTVGPVTLGFRVWLDGSFEVLGGDDLPPEGGAGEAEGSGTNEQFIVASGRDWILLEAAWDVDSPGTSIVLTTPTGEVLTEADILADPKMEIVTGLSNARRRVVAVDQPAAGRWSVSINDPASVTGLTFHALVDNLTPTVQINNVAGGTWRAPVTIQLDAFDADSNATVSLYYDTDAAGLNGTLIATGLAEADGSLQHEWVPIGVPEGDYFVYAMIDDQVNAPVYHYGTQEISITAAGISGSVWDDADGDRLRDAAEPGRSGIPVYLDSNGNGALDAAEPMTLTRSDDPATASVDEAGSYRLTDVAPGTHSVRVAPHLGRVASVPANGGQPVTLTGQQVVSGVDFATRLAPGAIEGVVWNDVNGNDLRDETEPALADVPVRLLGPSGDAIGIARTDADGAYHFAGLVPGNYAVEFEFVGKMDTLAAKHQLGVDSVDSDADSISGRTDFVAVGSGQIIAHLDAGMSDNPTIVNLSSLDGQNGLVVKGEAIDDNLGSSVSSVGDINGDGLDDFVVAAPYATRAGKSSIGKIYVVFGRTDRAAITSDLTGLDGTNGFAIDGQVARDQLGSAVSAGGDINGDGFGDLVLGAWLADPRGRTEAGSAYIVFGKSTFAPAIDLSDLDGSSGFRVDGGLADDNLGVSVGGSGDINGDGFDDVALGAYYASPRNREYAGRTYVVFGKASGFPAAVDAGQLNGNDGFALDGAGEGDYSGSAVSLAGDVNGDGLDDLVIGAPYANTSQTSAGETYVVFGRKSGFPPAMDLRDLDGTIGFRLQGASTRDYSGTSVSLAGDINGDGFDDLLIGAPGVNARPQSDNGRAYLVFGSSQFTRTISLSSLNGADGFEVSGLATNNDAGTSVHWAGDVNGDGYDDLLIGASGASTAQHTNTGAAYILFGQAGGFGPSRSLADLTGTNGFHLLGISTGDHTGAAVSSAGDSDGDGFDDVLISADRSTTDALFGNGQVFLVFGADFSSAVTHMGSVNDDQLTGDAAANVFVAGQGDDRIFGDGGRDSLRGGAGLDVLEVPDLAFLRVDGGSGFDSLHFVDRGTIDLTALAKSRLVDVEQIDLHNGRTNRLVLGPQQVLQASDATNRLIVLRDGADVVERGAGWTDDGLVDRGGQSFRLFSQGAAELLVLEPPAPWHNGADPLDVDTNGQIQPLDALIPINFLNAHPNNSTLPSPPDVPPPFLDVNGDNLITPLDPLIVINFLNARAGGEGSDSQQAAEPAFDQGLFVLNMNPSETIVDVAPVAPAQVPVDTFHDETWRTLNTPTDWVGRHSETVWSLFARDDRLGQSLENHTQDLALLDFLNEALL